MEVLEAARGLGAEEVGQAAFVVESVIGGVGQDLLLLGGVRRGRLRRQRGLEKATDRTTVIAHAWPKNEYRDSHPRSARCRGLLAPASGSSGTANRAPLANPPRNIARHRWESFASACPPRAPIITSWAPLRPGSWWEPSGFGATRASRSGTKPEFGACSYDEEHRGQGIARRLMAEVLRRARSLAGTGANHPHRGRSQAAAKRLYASLGFTVFGHERGALKMGDVYVDEDLHGPRCIVNPKIPRIKGFRKILRVQKFLRGADKATGRYGASAQSADYQKLRRAAPSTLPTWY